MANPFRTQSKNPFRQGEITAQPATQESMDAWRDKVMGTAGMDAIGRALVTKAQSAFGNAGGDTARAVYQAPATFARGVGGGLVAANAGINQMLRDYTPLGAVPGLGDWLQGASNQGAKDAANLQAAATANYQTDIGRDVGGAINSLGATAPLTAGAIIAKNPAIMSGGMGAQTGFTEYGNARQAGLKPLEALPYAATQTGIEMLTEKMPADALVDAFKTKNPVANLIKSPLKYGVGEMAGEQLATLGQDFAKGAYIDSRTNPNWVQAYKDGRLDAARSTAVSSLVMGPGNVGIAATAAQAAKAAAQGVRRIEGKNPFRQASANPQPDQQRLAAALDIPTNPDATRNATAAVRAALVNGGMKTRADIPQTRPRGDAMAQTLDMLRKHEGFSEGTYWDVNAHRLGYGTDTITDANGKVRRVQQGDKVSRADAERDLARRANDFRNGARNLIGAAAFDRLPAGAQAALTSVAYNYGSLNELQTVVNAARSGDLQQLSKAIEARGVDNEGINAKRRSEEAAAVLGGGGTPANQSMLSDGLSDGLMLSDGLSDGLMNDNLQPQYTPEDNSAQAEAAEEMQRSARMQREAAEEMQDAARKTGKQTEVYLGEQMRNARLQMLEADDLQPTLADAANQYRDRNRAASQVQVNRIAQNLQPELLGDSMQADTGAPTLAKDGKTIIGGNGRVMGIAQAYAQGSGQSYKQYLIDNAEQFGLNPAEVAAMDKPVLVRRLDDDVDIAKAAVASNEGGGLGMSALEQARVDADRLPDFGTFAPGDNGELNTPANRGFIRQFVGQMPTTVQAQMVDAQGMLSQDGIRRLHNAMLHRAYGNSPALSRMVESADQGARNMVSAMMQAAPTIAKARDHIKSGAMHDADIAADIVSAVEKLNQLRESGGSTADYLAQQGMFEDDLSPVARDLLQFLDEHKRSAKAIATLLRNYYDLLGAQGSPNQADVFGDNTAPDKQQLLRKAANDYEQQNQPAEQNELFRKPESFRRPQEPDRQTGQQPESRRGDETGVGEDAGGVEEQQEQVSQDSDGLKFSRGQTLPDTESSFEATAEENGGAFDPKNGDIRYSRSEDTKRASPEQIKQTRQAIEQAVGKQNMRHIEIVAREEVARPDNAEDLRDAQGWYDPKTQRITLIAEALPNQRTAQFVAWHELGHRKIDVDGWEKWQALFRTAYNGNPVIKQVADNIFNERKGAADGAALNKFLAVEEAVADLYAAHKTGDYAAFEQRNGVKVPQAMRNTLGGYFARMANHLRTVLAKVMGVERNTISDAEIYGWLKKLDKADETLSDGLNDNGRILHQFKNMNVRVIPSSALRKSVYHRRNNRDTPYNDVGYMQFAENEESVASYGENHWILPKGNDAQRISAGSEAFKSALREWLSDNLDYLEAKGFMTDSPNFIEDMVEEANPDDIVDSAGFWDAHEIMESVWDEVLEPNGWLIVETNDGAIVFEPELVERASGSLNEEMRFSRNETKDDNSKSAYEAAKAAGETELTFHQWQQVRTPEFKAWFGDWENDPDNASKVINPKTGEPLVVYHGSMGSTKRVDNRKVLTKEEENEYRRLNEENFNRHKDNTKGIYEEAEVIAAEIRKEMAGENNQEKIESLHTRRNILIQQANHFTEIREQEYKEINKKFGQGNELITDEFVPFELENHAFDISMSADVGTHFTASRKVAEGFAYKLGDGKGSVFPVFLNIRNLYRHGDIFSRYQGLGKALRDIYSDGLLTDKQYDSLFDRAERLDQKDYEYEREWGQSSGVISFWDKLNQMLQKKKGIGFVYRNEVEGGGDSYVAFKANQIKSATDNSGAFDPKNDDIRFSRGEALSSQEKRFFNEIGELEVGVKAYNKLAGLLKRAFAKIRMANTAPEQFTQMMRDYRAQLNVAGRTAKTVADAGVKMTEAERKLLSDVLEKELPPGAEVSPELQELAGAMREILTQQSDELVALGMLSEASRERFRDTYLPRLYAKHMTGDTALDALNKELGKAMRGALGNAVKGQHLKGRGLFKEVKRGERAKYEADGWEMRHDYGNKGKKAGVVVMWRDYTREERASMGEERDAMMRFTSGYIKTQSDIAKGTLFKRIAEDGEMTSDTAVEGWTHVPDTEIAGTGGVKRYGALAGKWVHPEVAYHLQQQFYIDDAVQKAWRQILGWWKIGKTVYNAVAHVNNFISNIVMTFSAGGKLRDIVPMALEIKRKGALYNEALEHGLIGEAVDVAGLQEMFVGLNNVSEDKLLDGLIMRMLKRADKLVLNLPSKAGKLAQKAYRVEDEVFKLVLYKRGKEAGLSPQEAADYALTFMFDYSEVPQGVKWLRDTGILPFVSYTYKAMPAMARLALTRPHRALMVTGFMYGINALSYALLGGAGDEDEEREYMPDYQKGYTVFGTPKLIRLPWNDSKGKPIFIDVYRWLPLGDFADTQNQMGGLPLPQWATPNGPVISHAFALLGNKDTFTGRDIVKPYQSGGEKAATYGKWLAAQWLPASVGVPFSYHTNNVLEGAKSQFEGTKMADALEWMGYTGTTYRGEDKQLYRSLPGAFGVKLRGEKPADMKAAKQRQIGYEVREVKADMSRIRRDNTLTDAAKQARLEKRREALERLYEKRPD